MSNLKPILFADDSPRDTKLAMTAFAEHGLANRVINVEDGEEALDYLYRRGRFAGRENEQPAFVVLDLKMPKVDGMEVLRTIKGDPVLRTIPVVIMTSSREEQDLVQSYELGVNAFVVKPVKFLEFVAAVKTLGGFWAALNEPPPVRTDQPLNKPLRE
jgi:CheY-like chemotaxis protein